MRKLSYFCALWLLLIFISVSCTTPPPTIATATNTFEPSDTPSPPATIAPFELTKQANQTQNAVYELTRNAVGTDAILTPSKTPSPTLTPYPFLPLAASTSTLSPSLIWPATPAPLQECPVSSNGTPAPNFETLIPDQPYNHRLAEPYLLYLNSGGSLQNLPNEFQPSYIKDLTNDGVADYVFNERELYVIGCFGGQYVLFLHSADYARGIPQEILEIKDANQNGISELYIFISQDTQGGQDFQIYEWSELGFQNVIVDVYDRPAEHRTIYTGSPLISLTFEDFDNNGILELLWYWDIPLGPDPYTLFLPSRRVIQVYSWNGQGYEFQRQIFDPPQYRFQAVQDGDRASLEGRYDDALALYQDAIFSDQLAWWNHDRFVFMIQSPRTDVPLTPPPDVFPDPYEYPNLAAYARYRIILLHVVQGNISAAQTVYNTLLIQFPRGQPGEIFSELATEFWQTFQQSGDIEASCAKAIEFATANLEEVFTYLGNSNWTEFQIFGEQSIYYYPEDVCPFK